MMLKLITLIRLWIPQMLKYSASHTLWEVVRLIHQMKRGYIDEKREHNICKKFKEPKKFTEINIAADSWKTRSRKTDSIRLGKGGLRYNSDKLKKAL